MKLANLVGERFKERPADCSIDSQALMVRGGYIKYVANGIYSSFMPMKRITKKIENIIRQEMDAIDGQEVLFPVVMPASLWEESGRYKSVGSELVRFTDRNDGQYVLGMTHEEAAVQLVREYGGSYLKYPFMIYQIQTKFRDEARPRGGLIRVREFTMKDAYSFHTSQQDLEEYYERCHKAYERIFARVGVPEVVSVKSDSGMMGGSVSHEFMLLTGIGEDSIVICPECGYRANMEAAETVCARPERKENASPLEKHATPGSHTIDEVCAALGCTADKTCKAVVYRKETDDKLVVLFLRGDCEVNEAKLKNLLGSDVFPATLGEDSGLEAGFIGPVGLKTDAIVIYDRTLEGMQELVCGANCRGYHYTGLDMQRDVPGAEYSDVSKVRPGGICPVCGKPVLTVKRGIEVGNIFQLGTKYTKSMNMTYVDEKGESHYPIMGCYGIGVGRLAASVCEVRHDDYGPIWPMSIAPWQVHLCAVRADDEQVREKADELYSALMQAGVEVIYDDRSVSAGIMFSDADLLGVPLRLVVSPRNNKQGVCELVSRDKSFDLRLPLDDVKECVKAIKEKIAQMLEF